MGLMADEVQGVDAGRIKDKGQAWRLAHAEKTLREVEVAVGAELENNVPNPVPAVFEALDKGQKIHEMDKGMG